MLWGELKTPHDGQSLLLINGFIIIIIILIIINCAYEIHSRLRYNHAHSHTRSLTFSHAHTLTHARTPSHTLTGKNISYMTSCLYT